MHAGLDLIHTKNLNILYISTSTLITREKGDNNLMSLCWVFFVGGNISSREWFSQFLEQLKETHVIVVSTSNYN